MATFTKIASAPNMIRYYVLSTDGSAGSLTITTLLSDLSSYVKSPLGAALSKLNAAGNWGASGDPVVTPNPAVSPKISVTLTPWTASAGTITAAASYTWNYSGSVNQITILGGPRSDTSFGSEYTSAILEIRYNHSIMR